MSTTRFLNRQLMAPFQNEKFITLEKDHKRYYRIFIAPILPSVNRCLDQEDKLLFKDRDSIFQSPLFSNDSLKLDVFTDFNVQTAFAPSLTSLKKMYHNRFGTLAQFIPLVVDVPQECFQGHDQAVEKQWDKKSVLARRAHFMPTINNLDTSWGRLVYTGITLNTHEPVYQQAVQVTETRECGPFSNTLLRSDKTQKAPHDLQELSENGLVQVTKYQGQNFGADVTFTKETPTEYVGRLRVIGDKCDWVNTNKSKQSKASYLHLTEGGVFEYDIANAAKIAALFSDYANKGHGISALFHLHMSRHKDNVKMAQEIGKELAHANYASASNAQVATYLLGKYDELVNDLNRQQKAPINPAGSFARRMDYAIAQLTNGQCYSIAEYRAYQESLEREERSAPRLT